MVNYDLISTYTYTSFAKAGAVKLNFPFPTGGIVVFCSGAVSRLTGFTFSYVPQMTSCLNDCKDSKGDRRGACTAAGVCACDEDYVGSADCSIKLRCSGRDDMRLR